MHQRQGKIKVLICGVLPPPNFGHSIMYKVLLGSSFVRDCDVIFWDMKHPLWCWFGYVGAVLTRRPRYVLFDTSFNKKVFLRDYFFCLTGALLGCRIVLHDMGQYLPETYASAGLLLRGLIKHLLRMACAVIVISARARRIYAPFFDSEKVFVVAGSVEDTAGMAVAPMGKEKELEVLYFSFLSASKGLWTALKAAAVVARASPQVHFTFGGGLESPQLEKQMQDFIREQGLQKHVTCVGYVGDAAQRTAYYRRSDVFIFPTHRDSFGLVLLHAMAERVPVIASIEGTTPEIVEDGVEGFLVPKGDAEQLAQKILFLAHDAQLRRQMGEAGRKKYLGHYLPQVYGRRMTEVFGQIEVIHG